MVAPFHPETQNQSKTELDSDQMTGQKPRDVESPQPPALQQRQLKRSEFDSNPLQENQLQLSKPSSTRFQNPHDNQDLRRSLGENPVGSNFGVSRHDDMTQLTVDKRTMQSLLRWNHLTYLLYVLNFFTAGILWVIPLVMNYSRRKEAQGTWLATHFDWQIKTVWYTLILGLLSALFIILGTGSLGVGLLVDSSGAGWTIASAAMVILGILMIFGTVIWHIFRVARGWIALSEKRPIG